jgi:hypothetical protein
LHTLLLKKQEVLTMKMMNKIKLIPLKLFWSSWWGKAIIHVTFDRYKNSVLFKERCMYYGSIKAAKMFKWKEFKAFRKKVYDDKKTMFTILFKPVKIYKEFEEKNRVLKSNVDLS